MEVFVDEIDELVRFTQKKRLRNYQEGKKYLFKVSSIDDAGNIRFLGPGSDYKPLN